MTEINTKQVHRASRCEAVLQRCAKRAWRLALARGLLLTIGGAGGVFFAEFILDKYLDLPPFVRGVLIAGALLTIGKIALDFLFRPLRRSVDEEQLARRIESAYPSLKGLFLTAVQLSRPGNPAAAYVSPLLLQHVVLEAEDLTDQIDPKRLFPVRRLLAPGAVFCAVLILWAVSAVGASESLSVWKERLLLKNVPWPRAVNLVVVRPEGEKVLVARGDDLLVEVRVTRGTVRQVELVCDWGSTQRVEVMTGWGEKVFRYTVPNVIRPFSFYARGGDGRTPVKRVVVVPRPRIEAIEAEIIYPQYTGLAPQKSVDGSVKALAGSTVRYTAWTRPRVRSARFRFFQSGSKEPALSRDLPLEHQGSRTKLSGQFTVSASGYYTFSLESLEGFVNDNPSRYRVRAVPDRIPQVRITKPLGTEECTPEGAVAVEGLVTDDWGISAVRFTYRIKEPAERDPGPAKEIELPLPEQTAGRSPKKVPVSYTFELRPLGVSEGTSIYWTVEATDNAGGTGRSSEGLIVVVRPEDLRDIIFDRLGSLREELKHAAELQARARRRLNRLIADTKKAASLDAKAVSVLGQGKAEQVAVSRRVETAVEALRELRDRMQRNAVGDLQEQKWIGSLADELQGLEQDKVTPLLEAMAKVSEQASAGGASPSAVKPLVARQEEIEKELRDIVDRMTQFNDINQLVQQLQEILQVEERVQRYTKQLMQRP